MKFFHAEGKQPLESESLTIRVRGSSSTASTFLRSQVDIASSGQDVEGGGHDDALDHLGWNRLKDREKFVLRAVGEEKRIPRISWASLRCVSCGCVIPIAGDLVMEESGELVGKCCWILVRW